MKFEFSAGGIVFKKNGEELEILVCQHSQHHGWVFPKGIIGDKKKGEKKEETGVKGEIIKPVEPISYWYVFEGVKIKKTVYYFIMKAVGGDITKHDMEMENVEWLPKDKVLERLTYKSDKEIWEKSKELVESVSD